MRSRIDVCRVLDGFRTAVKAPQILTTLAICFVLAAMLPFVLAEGDPVEDEVEKILKAIDVDHYTQPDLPLVVDKHYAHSPVDVVPYGHVKPYKEFFLDQM